ncbi:hypothetical protein B0T25DRAFT_447104 [Lasiosphaeria hispida]|uniref:Extracellular protein n=1 Tax=Lasiosphaeria hispida TaxID=260671 RepID=A0AAJ0MHR7_9PEZI|nr:hypothetical protein B0T25DRAFT_447104 [Lasiosphaeria hispida]
MRFTHSFLGPLILGTGSRVLGHMLMSDPPSLRFKGNPHASNPDYSLTSPLQGADAYPCKGYHKLIGSPEGAPVATWGAGETHSMTIEGGAPHGGGSCQASISVDGGSTFRVIHSYVGGCPAGSQSTFSFTVPSDTPSTESALLGWTWFNNMGNREMYMDCAVVTIRGGSGGRGGGFSSLPAPLKANIGNGCSTVDSTNVLFPDPGPYVDRLGPGTPPVGSCGPAPSSNPGNGSGGDPSSEAGSSSGSPNYGSPDYYGNPGNSGNPGSPGSSGGMQSPGSMQPDPGNWTPGNTWPSGFNSAASEGLRVAASSILASAILTIFIHLFN